MKLTSLLTRLLGDDAPDEEERADAPQTFRVTVSTQDLPNTGNLGKTGRDSIAQSSSAGTDDDDNQDYDDTLPVASPEDQPDANARGPRRIFSRIFSAVFPSPSDEEEIRAYIPHYRVLPILSGIAIPFCILLDIPGLTADWYTYPHGGAITPKHNPPLLDAGIAISLFCAVLANLCLVVRFLEKRIKTMTILCILFLSIHDIINVLALSIFGATKGNYTFSQAFWMTMCSTIVSMFTNLTLIVDFIRTSDFRQSGSGLTRRQRSLVIIIIGLFCYIAIGALVNSLLLDLTFINGLYFTVVTIETIGFGDIVPTTRASRIFVCFYATVGVVNLAFVVGYVREAVLEGLDFGYRRRLLEIQERRRAVRRRRRVENRWKHAIAWRLRERHAPIWIHKNTNGHKSFWSILTSYFWHAEWGIRSIAARSTHHTQRRHGMQLNLWALPPCQLEAAALEAGCSVDTFLPTGFYDTYDQDGCYHSSGVGHRAFPSWFVVHTIYHRDQRPAVPATQRRLGAMAAILTKLSLHVYESGGSPLPDGHDIQDASAVGEIEDAPGSSGSLQTSSSEDRGDYRTDVVDTEKKAYITRSGLSWGWFLIFWMGGAAIFKATEDWSFATSVYFCFISFTTIGYGDLTPTTPAGRSVFVLWALIGVATMTIFISVVSEAYASRYKGILGRNSFKRLVHQYRERHKVEFNERVQRIGTSVGTNFSLRETSEREETRIVDEKSLPTNATADAAVSSTSEAISHAQHAQRSLEQLPRQILAEMRLIQQYMQLVGNFDGHTVESERFVEESVWGLIDDVAGGNRSVAMCTKQDILKDGEARQTIMLLGIERSLKELVSISEKAIAATQERERSMATLEQEKEHEITV